jgi:predicted TIM-barrel fold metal-dependent hydrolase
MIKTKTPVPSAPGSAGSATPAETPTFRNVPEVDAKIDAHIKEYPKYWAYVQAMPRERLERTVVLNEVRELERQQRMREGVLKQISGNPELKQAYDRLVKDLPEEQKEAVIAQIARSARYATARSLNQQQSQQQSKGEKMSA